MTAMTPGRTGMRLILCLSALGAILQGMEVHVRLTLGQSSAQPYSYSVSIQPGSDSTVSDFRSAGLESDDSAAAGVWSGRAGAGDTDSISFTLSYPDSSPARTAHVMWS